MEDYKIGYFIQKLRKEHHMTQVELANQLNVSNKAVSKWELGESNPDIYLLSKISETFGITIDELFQGKRNITTTTNYRK